MSSDQQHAAAPLMRLSESQWPSPGIWLGGLGFGAALGLIPGPIDTTVAIITGILGAVLIPGALAGFTPRLELANGVFSAGRAQVPVSLIETVEPLDAASMKLAHGRDLNARAFLCTRAWIRTGIKVTLNDPQDPTPFWLISTRRPADWVAALRH